MSVKSEHILLVGVVAVGGYFLWRKREEGGYLRDGLVGPMPFPAPAPAPMPVVTPTPAESPWWSGVIDALPGVSRLVQQWMQDVDGGRGPAEHDRIARFLRGSVRHHGRRTGAQRVIDRQRAIDERRRRAGGVTPEHQARIDAFRARLRLLRTGDPRDRIHRYYPEHEEERMF